MPQSASDQRLYVGLMSGTSMDGVDAALVALTAKSCSVVAAYTTPYEKSLREALHQASRNPAQCGLDEFGRLDRQVADAFTAATVELLADAGIAKSAVTAIGSHGQTIRHRPRSEFPFTIQIGDPNVIAAGTGITTVADFRRRDIALGGEGAPLAPAFHHWLFAHADLHRVVLNLGGFANITVLQAGQSSTFGFDTGPGNTLMDAWCMQQLGESFDAEGHWAASGKINKPLLRRMLDDAYFAAAPPKSTGFEYFNLAWLAKHIDGSNIDAADVQATLCELTVQSVAAAISRHAPETNEVWLCGGGARNSYLVSRMRETLVPASLKSTSELGVAPDWIEAAAFAWLAACRLANQTGNLPDVTGAREAAILGGIYAGRPAAPGP